jgi:hypothetical protein
MTLPTGQRPGTSIGASHTFVRLKAPQGVSLRVRFLVERSIAERCDEEIVVVIYRVV